MTTTRPKVRGDETGNRGKDPPSVPTIRDSLGPQLPGKTTLSLPLRRIRTGCPHTPGATEVPEVPQTSDGPGPGNIPLPVCRRSPNVGIPSTPSTDPTVPRVLWYALRPGGPSSPEKRRVGASLLPGWVGRTPVGESLETSSVPRRIPPGTPSPYWGDARPLVSLLRPGISSRFPRQLRILVPSYPAPSQTFQHTRIP